jgi:hypothetical protein
MQQADGRLSARPNWKIYLNVLPLAPGVRLHLRSRAEKLCCILVVLREICLPRREQVLEPKNRNEQQAL